MLRIRRLTRAATRILHANVGRLATPLKVNFALTYWCQYRCRTCNIWQRKPADELTTSELLTFVRRNQGISWLDLTGGEIFLRSDAAEVLEAFAGDMPRLALLHFPTNGFLTDRIVPIVGKIATRSRARIIVTVSVDGDEALNDAVRGIRGGYRRQVATFNGLRAIRGVRPVIGMTLSVHNAGVFERSFEAWQKDCPGLGIDDVHLNVATVSDHYYGNAGAQVSPPADALQHDLARYRELRAAASVPLARLAAHWVENRYLSELSTYLETRRTPMRCHSLRSSCFIDPWGTVYPCITYSRPIGRLRDTGMDLAAIWESAGARRLQREIWNGDCPQCWTACEAYQSILGNVLNPRRRLPPVAAVRTDGPRVVRADL